MQKMQPKQASLGDVAKAAGISKTSAGCALRNHPGVSEATRRRVRQIADRLGYSPDARLVSRMTGIRLTATKDLLPIAWLNTHTKKDAWHAYSFLSPYLEGARARCLELGFRIEEIWTRQPGFTMRRIAQIIEQQGIEGVIVTEPARHVRLKWKELAGVSIGGGLLVPALHRIAANNFHNLVLALKSLKRLGYQRIGICLAEEADRFSDHEARAAALYFNSTIPTSRRVKHLFTPYIIKDGEEGPMIAAWIKRERPDVVIGHSSHLINWVQSAGFRVPEEVGVVHLAIEDDVIDWAGVYANKREIGRQAADMVVSLIHSRQFGVPEIPSSRLIRGAWRAGRTLLVPKPK